MKQTGAGLAASREGRSHSAQASLLQPRKKVVMSGGLGAAGRLRHEVLGVIDPDLVGDSASKPIAYALGSAGLDVELEKTSNFCRPAECADQGSVAFEVFGRVHELHVKRHV